MEKHEALKHQEELWDGFLTKRENVDNTVKKLPDSIYRPFMGGFVGVKPTGFIGEEHYDINDKVEDVKNSMHDSANFIYKDLFGKGVDDRSISYNYGHKGKYFEPSNAFFNNSTFVDINVDKEMVDYMNKELKQDNLLRKLIDVNHDGDLSKDEIQDYFDKFRKYETGISVNDLTNIFAVKNNAIVQDSLFGDKEEIGYRDIKGNSIITDNDFDLLDKADGTVDGIISKDTFAKFGFDKNGDGIIDKDEYEAGMSRVKEVVANSVGYEHGAIQKEFDNQPPQVQQFMLPLKVPEYMELCVDEHNHNMVKGDFDFDQNGDEIIGNNEYMKSCIKESIDKLSHEEGAGYDMTTKEPNNQPSQYQQSIPDEHKMQ